jgi:hypothetical protein
MNVSHNSQPQLVFDPVQPDADTYTGRVAHLFLAHPGEWLDGLRIATVGGAYAWRSRVADARREYGLRIVNRQRKIGLRTISEYRLEV